MYREGINNATKEYPFLIEHTDVKYIPHFHDETELVFVTEGNLNVTVENRSFVLRKGEICIITPRLIHNLYSYEPNKAFVIKMFPVIDIGNIQLDENVISPGSEKYDILRGYVNGIMLENKNRADGFELAVNIYTEKIFLFIIRNMMYRHIGESDRIKLLGKSHFFNDVTEFLENHYADEFSLNDAAEHLNYTKSYFCHRFKQITGVTFWEYYTVFRLEKAIEMMKAYPNKLYAEIAAESGFKNIRSFNQAFRKHHNCTPREYAKKYHLPEYK